MGVSPLSSASLVTVSANTSLEGEAAGSNAPIEPAKNLFIPIPPIIGTSSGTGPVKGIPISVNGILALPLTLNPAPNSARLPAPNISWNSLSVTPVKSSLFVSAGAKTSVTFSPALNVRNASPPLVATSVVNLPIFPNWDTLVTALVPLIISPNLSIDCNPFGTNSLKAAKFSIQNKRNS